MKPLLARLSAFFGPVVGSVLGQLNATELARSILAAFGAASFTGLALAILGSIAAHAGQIFPSPAVAMAVAFAVTQLADLVRRLGHGASPSIPGPDTYHI